MFFLPLSRSFSSSLSPTTLSSAPAVSFFSFFLGRQRDLKQRFSLALMFLCLYHTTRPRRCVEINRIKN